MIGLGNSATTCFNVHGGQEFTRRNSINYLNDAFDIVKKLPRPLSRCGVVRVRSAIDSDDRSFYNTRPDLVKNALTWLIGHNLLCQEIESMKTY